VLRDDFGDLIGTREYLIDQGLPASHGDDLVRAFAMLTPVEVAGIFQARMLIERAKGALMVIYDVEPDEAFEMLKWHCDTYAIALETLAAQLLEDLAGIAWGHHLSLRAACDNILFIALERITNHAGYN
jgi:hypothetical protein